MSIHFVIDNAIKMAKFNLQKRDKNNLRIISKPHAYIETMTKHRRSYERISIKTVGGVAPTRYPLSIHFVIDNAKKRLSSTCEKSGKN